MTEWEADGGSAFRRPTNGVGETIDLMMGFLFGACAIRSGFAGDSIWMITDQFLANQRGAMRPSWGYLRTQDGAWRPPGWLLPATAGPDPARREIAFNVLRSAVDVFSELEPIETRRAPLSGG